MADNLDDILRRAAQNRVPRRSFLAAVSHELRTPAANVQVTLESLLAGSNSSLPAARSAQELLATIAERVDQRSTGITAFAANPEVLGLQ